MTFGRPRRNDAPRVRSTPVVSSTVSYEFQTTLSADQEVNLIADMFAAEHYQKWGPPCSDIKDPDSRLIIAQWTRELVKRVNQLWEQA